MPARVTLFSLIVFAFAFACRLPRCDNHIFLYDGASYVQAARNGFWPLYTGLESGTLVDFIRNWRAGGEFRRHPWSVLLDRGDGAALRHFHAPASFYLYALTDRTGAHPAAAKILSAVISSATIALVFGMALIAGVPLAFAALGAFVLSLSPALLEAGANMSPHPLYSLAAMLAIAAFVAYQATRRKAWLATCAAATAIALATLEFSLLLVITFACMLGVISWRTWRAGHVQDNRKLLLLTVACLMVCLFAIWPGGFLRGGYALSYGTLIFQGFLRNHDHRDLVSTLTRLGTYHLRVGVSWAVLLALSVYGTVRNRRSVLVLTTGIYAALFFIEGLGNGFWNATYASHFIFAVTLVTMLNVPRLLASLRWSDRLAGAASLAVLTVLAVGQLRIALYTGSKLWDEEPSRVEAIIRKLEASYPPGTTFVSNTYSEPFSTYARRFNFVPTVAASGLTPRPWTKLGRHYLLIDTEKLTDPLPELCVKNMENHFLISCSELP